MTCTTGFPTFRLLDAYAGWDPGDQPYDEPVILIGFDDPAGLRLSALNPNEVNPSDLLGSIPPVRLARGCGSCDWYLITPAPPAARLLRRDACSSQWISVWRSEEHTSELQSPCNLVCRLLLEKKNKILPKERRQVNVLYMRQARSWYESSAADYEGANGSPNKRQAGGRVWDVRAHASAARVRS